MKQERGKLLYQGIQERWDDTIEEQKKMFFWAVFLSGLCLIFAILTILGYVTILESSLLSFIVFFAVFLFIFPFVIATGGLEIDGIYGNGITNRNDYLFKRLTGKSFHRFGNITKIGYGQYTWNNVTKNFVLIYENNSISPACGNFNDKKFKNDFYDRMVETLKVKCPNATWEEVDFLSIPKWKR